ncbi:SusC/RagA family TonB-linked outer membrane protein [Mucilaginibacter sp. PPCGB 2223]|uniref:SusC/RagA family TonB-linked outer membrane protein n=1 Tax=Mucilaginibacter sp. PPCGB 2223 TaxID=1886027 RepID=UPI0008248C88|nr:SusC/RagA family TonB-linked outer membrane protein [Mucilaginibacter sp. PPCGB 2223]OCX51701.1 SusC/RagA family TonB-linked outer membrane protein [Mucilaginibacter sp. PPCGB 2223]
MRKILTHICCIVALSVCFGKSVRAQEKILIKGKVIDENKQGIIGASVIEQDNDKRTVTGVATDIDGNFALPIKSVNNKISFSYIGYKTQIKPIGAQRTFLIQLVSNNVISEVQITSQKTTNNGTGLNIDVRDQTTANATIQAKDLEELQATSIDQALQGRLPGVDIVASSGDPGAGMAIRIRGTSSINGATNPLIVVDGMPYETAIPTDFNFATADEQGYASLLSIAPSDIKDITVLKDAAATAVWGPRASNGVLIINTKRGTVSAPVVSYTFKGSLFQQPSAIPMLNGNQYSELIPEEYQNGTGSPLNTYTYPEFQHDPSNPYYYYNYGQNTDWLKAITRTGYSFDNNLSITGGGEKARYFASVGYTNQVGTTLGTGLNRLNARLNLDYIVSTKIHFRTDIAYTHSVTIGDYTDSGSPTIRAVAQNKMPNMSIYEYNEYGQQTPNYFTPASNVQGQYVANNSSSTYNPVALAKLGINNSYGDRITPHFNLTYTIMPELLTATSDIQFDINTNRQRTFLPASATGQASSLGTANRAYEFDTDAFDVFTKTNLVYTPHIGDNQDFQGLLSIQTDDTRSVNQSLNTANTASDVLQDPSAQSIYTSSTTQLGVASGLNERRTVAALLSAQYKLLDRYIIHVDLRGDGNSRFGPGHRYGLFPSASARYRMSGEPFMKKFNFINDLSFRGSYGVSGNAPTTDYSFYANYLGYKYSYLGQTGVYPSNIELDNLRFEKVTGQNLGMNLIMFNYRVNFDLEIYRNRTTDLFFNTNLPAYSGYSSVNLNVGTLDNQGFEISLNTTPLKSRNWIIDFDFNIAHNENVIRALSPYVSAQTGTGLANGNYIQTLQVGNPLGSFYGYIYQGVYSTYAATVATDRNGNPIKDPNGTPVHMLFNYPSVSYPFQAGDAKYADINHDGVIDARDIVYLGNGNPTFTGGFGPTITFKRNWKLNAFFSYRTGFQLINMTELNTTNLIGFNNQSTAVLRRWEKPGDVTDIPRALYRQGYNSLGSSRYVSDGSYLRWTSLTLRYNIDQLLAKKLGIKSASVYVTGQNLYTWTKYLGQDPEISPRAGDIYQLPVDQSTTPASKTYTLGLTASF